MSESKKAAERSHDPLLHTKLMPPRLPSAAISRDDLLRRLDDRSQEYHGCRPAEIYRVLKPGGLAVISDLRHDASLNNIEEEIKGMHLNRFNESMVRWTFKNMLLKNAYSVAELKSMIAKTPFGEGKIRVEGIGFQAWLEK